MTEGSATGGNATGTNTPRVDVWSGPGRGVDGGRRVSLSDGRTSFMGLLLILRMLVAGLGGVGGGGNSESEGGERARFSSVESCCARKLDERGACPVPA